MSQPKLGIKVSESDLLTSFSPENLDILRMLGCEDTKNVQRFSIVLPSCVFSVSKYVSGSQKSYGPDWLVETKVYNLLDASGKAPSMEAIKALALTLGVDCYNTSVRSLSLSCESGHIAMVSVEYEPSVEGDWSTVPKKFILKEQTDVDSN